MSAVEDARRLVQAAEAVAVLTGAGISTDSRHPRLPRPQRASGPRTPRPRRRATLQHYLADPEVRKRAWRNRLDSPAWTAQPNAGHLALVELERQGQAAHPHHPEHRRPAPGRRQRSRPRSSRSTAPSARWAAWTAASGRRWSGPSTGCGPARRIPPCRTCGGILKSATISFGQNLVPDDLERAERAARECDLLLAVGTTLAVYPVGRRRPDRPAPRGAGGDRQRRAHRRSTTWPTPSSAARSARCSPLIVG